MDGAADLGFGVVEEGVGPGLREGDKGKGHDKDEAKNVHGLLLLLSLKKTGCPKIFGNRSSMKIWT